MKTGVLTSEFWLTGGAAAGAFAYLPEAPSGSHAIAAGLIVIGAGLYAVARSLAKKEGAA